MRYFVSAADDSVAADYVALLENHGYSVLGEYENDSVVLSMGGDGSILYNARRFDEPTILPVAGRGSEANRIEVGETDLLDRLADLEDGRDGIDYRLDSHRKLVAEHDGTPIREGFTALNDIHLHHADPVRAAKFAVRVLDRPDDETGTGSGNRAETEREIGLEGGDTGEHSRERTVYEAEKVIGDGLLVATPFGSSGYYRSISGGVFETGLGVAFNNVHKPANAPRSITLSSAGRVELRLLTTTRSASAVLARDDDTDVHELESSELVSISLSDQVVEIVRFDD